MAERMAKDTTAVTPKFQVVDLFIGNDHMTEFGSWQDTDAAGTVVDHGTYVAVFRKTASGWECIREMSVSAKTKEAPAAAI